MRSISAIGSKCIMGPYMSGKLPVETILERKPQALRGQSSRGQFIRRSAALVATTTGITLIGLLRRMAGWQMLG